MTDLPSETELDGFETLAAELARLAGAEIEAALGRTLRVGYKGAEGSTRDPVSEVDEAVEQILRARIGASHPKHDIIGEEMDDRPGRDHDHVWAVDPVDGTANFINGLPLFSASIGLLVRGRPVVGALWCSTSHRLRPGVYSARAGGPLRFDGTEVTRAATRGIRRRLIGLPEPAAMPDTGFDVRKTGSAAIECAFVAAGLLAGARFATPNVWDVAGGVALVRAAGGTVRCGGPEGWAEMDGFLDGAPDGDLARWGRPLMLGTAEAVEVMAQG
ncbi:inositol monophosphatase family protein [Jannaschia formosa]|uniref:inositol monophosphatase family protein n=1 Tax=Jannaschia formosa TaxID=2259592 RepID=UPI000E1BB7C6|nr:inositol monophosphatase [Jannaschia formosa]TFL19382.1 inositol monophosphatase [Jannaschia formosa]